MFSKKFGRIVFAVIIVLLILFFAHFDMFTKKDDMSPTPGTFCTVRLRRDALGAGSSNPISPFVDVAGGADISFSAVLVSMNRDTVVMAPRDRDENARLWIPKSNILILEYNVEERGKASD